MHGAQCSAVQNRTMPLAKVQRSDIDDPSLVDKAKCMVANCISPHYRWSRYPGTTSSTTSKVYVQFTEFTSVTGAKLQRATAIYKFTGWRPDKSKSVAWLMALAMQCYLPVSTFTRFDWTPSHAKDRCFSCHPLLSMWANYNTAGERVVCKSTGAQAGRRAVYSQRAMSCSRR